MRALAGSRRASDESLGSKSTWSAAVGRSLGGGKERTGSIRTVGTTGTGGDLLGGLEMDEDAIDDEEEVEEGDGGVRRESVPGETEAQKVVRKEGAKEDAANTTPMNLTPTHELDSADGSPSLPPPVPTTSSSTGDSTPNDPTDDPLSSSVLTTTQGIDPVRRVSISSTAYETDAQSFVDAESQVGADDDLDSDEEAEAARRKL